MGKLFTLLDKLWDLLILNFVWIGYIFRGGIVLGFFPSTTALYGVIRQWLSNGYEEKTTTLFKRYYKENFKNANIIGWLLLFLSSMSFLNWYLIPSLNDPWVKTIIYAVIIPFSIILILIWLYLFPVLVHYDLRWPNYVAVIIRIAINCFSYTILQAVLLIIYGILFAQFTLLLTLFGITFVALIQVAICRNIFEKTDTVKVLTTN